MSFLFKLHSQGEGVGFIARGQQEAGQNGCGELGPRGSRNLPHPMLRATLSTATGIVKLHLRTTVLKTWDIIFRSPYLAYELGGSCI